MIPANLSLVPLSHERRAVMQAIAEVEAKYERGIGVAEFPYARTFFRILNGSKRVTVKDIGWFSLGLTAQSLRGNKQDWLAAIDRLIERRGACCWLPLSLSDGWRLFPETKFQMQERMRCVWISWMTGRSGAGAMSGKRLPADEIWSAA